LFLVGIRLSRQRDWRTSIQAAVYACNHSSNIEPPAIFMALRPLFPRLRIVYKAELRKLPVLVWVFDAAWVCARSSEGIQNRAGLRSIGRARHCAKATRSLFFPKAPAAGPASCLPFKKGGFLMAIKAQAPIIPVAVSGGRDAMRKGSPLIWPVTVKVSLGAPVSTAGLATSDRDGLVEQVRESIPTEALVVRRSEGSCEPSNSRTFEPLDPCYHSRL
jgi:1-acyl-sn-glycerol-3-phosphate acyltransferase